MSGKKNKNHKITNELQLINAAKEGNLDAVRHLLNIPGIDVNMVLTDTDDNSTSALICAAENGYLEIVKALLAVPGIDVNQNAVYSLPLYNAVKNNHVDIVRELLRRSETQIQDLDDCYDSSILNFVFENMDAQNIDINMDIVKELLKFPGTNVNCKDGDGNTPLAEAIKRNLPELVQELLKHKDIQLNSYIHNGTNDDTDETYLTLAGDIIDPTILTLLLNDPRIDVNYSTGHRLPAIIHALQNDDVEFLDLLLQHPKIDVFGKYWDNDENRTYTTEEYANNDKIRNKLRIAQAKQTLRDIATKEERLVICGDFSRKNDRTMAAWVKKSNVTGLPNNILNTIGKKYLGGHRRHTRRKRSTRRRSRK